MCICARSTHVHRIACIYIYIRAPKKYDLVAGGRYFSALAYVHVQEPSMRLFSCNCYVTCALVFCALESALGCSPVCLFSFQLGLNHKFALCVFPAAHTVYVHRQILRCSFVYRNIPTLQQPYKVCNLLR